MEAPPEVVLLGALGGVMYGLLAVGLVLTFRASGVLNLAHGQIGVFGAIALVVMVDRWNAPYWAALPAAIGTGALLAMVVELAVVRRLRAVPALMSLVATLGVAQLLQVAGAALAGDQAGSVVPQPPGVPSFELGALLVTPAYAATLLLGPGAVVALVLLLRRTEFGLALRASADNVDAARALGLRGRGFLTSAWGLAGALSVLTALLVLPAGSPPSGEAVGPGLLLRALAAGALAGMSSLPGALAAGVGLGVVEQLVRWNASESGVADAILFAIVLVALAVRPLPAPRVRDPAAWSAFEPWRRLPAAARAIPLVRSSGPAVVVAAGALACVLPLVAGPADEVRLATIACFALLGVSVWLLTGLGGELSLGQLAVAGVGAAAAAAVGRAGGGPAVGLLAAAGAGAGTLVALGVAARAHDALALPVVTLAFALAVAGWGLEQAWALGQMTELPPLRVGPLDTSSPTGAYALSAGTLAAALAWAHRMGRRPFARRLRAVRDNPPAARMLGIAPHRVRLAALAIAGAMAGVAGALLALAYGRITPESFAAAQSVEVVVIALVGGVAFAGGPLVGALWIAGLPAFVELSAAGLAASAIGWLVLLLYVPGGLAAVAGPLRDAGVRSLLRLAGHDARLTDGEPARAAGESDDPVPDRVIDAEPNGSGPRQTAEPVLEVVGVAKRYGDVGAVAEATLTVHSGEVVALVGVNGAGKTTLLDVICGFERADAGRIVLGGQDVTRREPEQRAARGLARSFQESRLFPTLEVRETVLLAAERKEASGAPLRAERLLELHGLAHYADRRVRTLSTGTRRIVELACLLAREPRVLLLDEPSAGLAAPEAERLVRLLAHVRAQGRTGILLVEHDAAMVGALADRVFVMREGRLAERPSGEWRDRASQAGRASPAIAREALA